jgi:hypothetical protein
LFSVWLLHACKRPAPKLKLISSELIYNSHALFSKALSCNRVLKWKHFSVWSSSCVHAMERDSDHCHLESSAESWQRRRSISSFSKCETIISIEVLIYRRSTGCIKKLNRFEIALNFAKQLLVSSFWYIYSFFGYLYCRIMKKLKFCKPGGVSFPTKLKWLAHARDLKALIIFWVNGWKCIGSLIAARNLS